MKNGDKSVYDSKLIDKDLSNNQNIEKVKNRLLKLISFYKKQKAFYEDKAEAGLVNKWKQRRINQAIMLLKIIITDLNISQKDRKELNELIDTLWEEIKNKPVKPFPKEF